jgi:hypothetical protein
MVGPAFFHKGDEKGAGFLKRFEVSTRARFEVGMRLSCCLRCEYKHLAVLPTIMSHLDDRFDYTDDRNGNRCLNLLHREGGGGVASDDEELAPFVVEEFCAFHSEAGNGLAGFGAVGETGGVAEVDVVGSGDEWEQGAEDGEAAEA